jgi:GYF domain 2
MPQQDSGQWFIARDGKRTGPITDMEIQAIAAHGYFRATDLVWRPGFAEWQGAFTVFPPQPVQPAAAAPLSPPAATVRTAPTAQTTPTAPPRREPAPAPVRTAEPVTVRPSAPPPPWSTPQAASETTRLPTAPPYRPDPNMQRPGDPRSTGRPLQQPVERVQTLPESEPEPAKHRPRRGALAAIIGCLALAAGGIWMAAYPGAMTGLTSALSALTKASMTSGPDTLAADLEQKWQRTAFWPVIKREFPDWYGERLRETAALTRERKPADEISKALLDQLIAFRRQNATQALSASTPRLKSMATAFLDNLKELKSQSTTACFTFISQGESTPGVLDALQSVSPKPTGMQMQVAAIFEAIAEGRKSPVTHDKPQKADYDALMEQLGKLGWTQADVATFADPRALARAEPARVCQMVQDWFVAHISLPDEGTQERLLGETLRPVVSG